MKKLITLIILALTVLSVCACKKDEDAGTQKQKLSSDNTETNYDSKNDSSDAKLPFISEEITPEKRAKNPIPENAADNACGENLTWHYDEQNAVLCIEGSGDMWDFLSYNEKDETYISTKAPWDDYSWKIKSVVLPDGLTSIGDRAFYNCDALVQLELPEKIRSIGDSAFWSCDKLEAINIPENVTEIGEDAFRYCYEIKNIEIPKSVQLIGNEAFIGCSDLEEIKVDKDNRFYCIVDGVLFTKNMRKLIKFPCADERKEYSIPAEVREIADSAFDYCDFTTLKIPAGLEKAGKDMFCNSTSIKYIEVAKDSKYFCDIDGILFSKDMKTIIEYPGKCEGEEYIIPDGVETVADHAFSSCSFLKSIVIPNSVRRIEDCAFFSCDFEKVIIPDGVEYIGRQAFSYCDKLTYVEIPASVKERGDDVFLKSKNLKEVRYLEAEE